MQYIEPILERLLRPSSFLIIVAVIVLTFVVKKTAFIVRPDWRPGRTLVKHPDSKTSTYANVYKSRWAEWWNEVGLALTPVLIGMLFAISGTSSLHDEGDTKLIRLLWDGSLGWFASFLYQIVRKLILQKTGVTLPDTQEQVTVEVPASSGEP